MRQFSRPQKPEEQIPEILPDERLTPLSTLVAQEDVANPYSEYEEARQGLVEELEEWDKLYDSISPYVKTVLGYTPTIAIGLPTLATALANENPKYAEYTEHWQTNAYQEGLFHDMLGQIVVDVRQELKDMLDSWDLVVTPETKSGGPLDKVPSQAAETTKDTTQTIVAKAASLREQVVSELGEVGKKINRCMIEHMFDSMDRSSTFDSDPLRKLAKTAEGLRRFLKMYILVRTPPFTKQWRSLSDMAGYIGIKALIRTASPMINKTEEKLCAPLYDLLSEFERASSEKYCGALDDFLGDIVTEMERIKSKAVGLQTDILRQVEEKYKTRSNIVESAAGRLKVSKIEVAIDKILEIVQRANLLSEAEEAMKEWLESHYPSQKLPAKTTTASSG